VGGVLLREGLLYLSRNQGIQKAATRTPVGQKLARRFVAGETLDDALTAIRSVNAEGMTATLDELGENVRSYQEAGRTADSYCRALSTMAGEQLDSNLSIKLTQLGLDLGPDIARTLAAKVVSTAQSCSNFVRVDMEGSPYTAITLDIVREIFASTPCVGAVIQSYLYRSQDDVRDLNRLGMRVRLVKGAYLEPATVAFPQKTEVDDNYRHLAEMLLAEGVYPAFATHDEAMISFIRTRAAAMGRSNEEWEFQMLYGVRRDLQRSLVREGYRLRVYIPFGSHWYPYLMRRLAERPGNLLFFLGNVAREARSTPPSG